MIPKCFNVIFCIIIKTLSPPTFSKLIFTLFTRGLKNPIDPLKILHTATLNLWTDADSSTILFIYLLVFFWGGVFYFLKMYYFYGWGVSKFLIF